MNDYMKTPTAAQTLGVTVTRLSSLLRYGRLKAPTKDTSGDYIWSPADIATAREVLAVGRRSRRVAVPA